MDEERTEDWVRADERWPEEELETVMVCTADGLVTLGMVYEGAWEVDYARWEGFGGEIYNPEVEYWRYLPHPNLSNSGSRGRGAE